MWSRDQSFYFFLSIFLFFIFLLKCWITLRNPRKNLPPSPSKLPIIGNLHQLGIVPHRSLRSLAQKHGPLMLLHFGSNPVLVVSSGDAAREIMKTNDLAFSNRPKSTVTSKLVYDCKDVVFSPYGEYWRQIRCICMLELLCSKRVQSFRAVREEETALLIEKIMGSFCSASPSVINLSEMLAEHISNVVCRAVLGRKYDGGGGAGGQRKFKKILMEFMELLGDFNVGDYVPWMRWLGHLNGLYGRVDKVTEEIDTFLELVIQEHVEERERNGGSKVTGESRRDFVDILLQIQRDDVAGFPLHKDTVKAIILDMFIGGVETTYATLEWTMAELLKDPKSMKRLLNEVREIGRGKQAIIEDDLKKMPYLQAIIKEIMRLHPSGSLIPRESTQNVKVMGYDITANTQVLINTWAIGRDPLVWDEPEEFKPERFLHSSIELRGHHFELIPFGAGRRSCPGAQFSLAVLQLALANLMLIFDFALPARERAEELDMSEIAGSVIHKKLPLLVTVTMCSC
ncbi:cytochrome P450 736A117-like isoform X3 [Diospyros lotus]|uniref:cytochrome P450 736A117-like isoform X3 n=1 Tax=Diospyros lotus TaxID=55363 RepID=UPI00225675A3|nr:cytochrome P450 736A117-like isoform X3 [Diospyros lotus]